MRSPEGARTTTEGISETPWAAARSLDFEASTRAWTKVLADQAAAAAFPKASFYMR